MTEETQTVGTEVQVKELSPNAPQQALLFLKDNNAKVHQMIEDLGSLRGAKRVLHALFDHPFGEECPHFSYQYERDLFNLGTQYQGNKLILLYCSFKEQELAEEIKKKALEEKNKENENGT